MASKKKEELLQPDVQTQAQPAAQSTYSTEGLDSRTEVEKAMANASYRPSQQVTDAANALKQWQQNRPADYQSSYQDGINELLGQLLERENFQYSYTRDPLYRQYEQLYTLNAHNASADAAAQAAALTGGYGSSYATSAAQQAYQQQIGGLASAIPTLYNLALDTYQSGGEELVNRLDQLNGQEQNAQTLYDRQLQDYYTQLQQKGEAYNDAYAKDYGQYQEHLNRLDTLHGYYTAQEQAQISQRQQAFNNVMTVLGVIGDVVQLAISGTTGLGSLAGSLLNTGYNIYSGNRAYEAERADTQWSQQMQEKQRQDALTQQQYDNTASERAYQDALKQQAFNNNVTSQKLNIAKGEWALKQSNAQQKAAQAAGKAAAAGTKSGSSGSGGKATGSSGSASGGSRSTVSAGVPYTAALLRSQGKSEVAIELIKRGHRIIADDAVEIKETNHGTLVASAPELIRHYMELRGIGVIDVRQLFGMSAIMEESRIDLVVQFEQWDETKFYDRLGIEDHHIDIMGVEIPCVTIPVRPGRNLASIVEVAAMNNRHRRYGFNAAQELAEAHDRLIDAGQF